jgi:hypothetical protein
MLFRRCSRFSAKVFVDPPRIGGGSSPRCRVQASETGNGRPIAGTPPGMTSIAACITGRIPANKGHAGVLAVTLEFLVEGSRTVAGHGVAA